MCALHGLTWHLQAFLNTWAATQWVTFWLEFLGCLFIGAAGILQFAIAHRAVCIELTAWLEWVAALLTVIDSARGGAKASLVGLSLTYALQVGGGLCGSVVMWRGW